LESNDLSYLAKVASAGFPETAKPISIGFGGFRKCLDSLTRYRSTAK
jgi:hypothetical protein